MRKEKTTVTSRKTFAHSWNDGNLLNPVVALLPQNAKRNKTSLLISEAFLGMHQQCSKVVGVMLAASACISARSSGPWSSEIASHQRV